jgi:L-iditol 2-dehydrogenase
VKNLSQVLYGIQDLRQREDDPPAPGPRQVIIRVEAVGVCGSDSHYYYHGRIGRYVVKQPMVLGHEAAGTVVQTGSGAGRHSVGSRVAIEPGEPCGECPICRIGRYNLCPDMRFLATPPVDGAFTRFIAVHEDFAHAIPKTLTAEEAALLEPLSVGLWAAKRAQIETGNRVLVTGAGPVGILAAEGALASGAGSVTVTDINDFRLGMAERHGFDAINVSAAGLSDLGGQFDVAIECSGAPGVLGAAMAALRAGGRAVMVGLPATPEVSLPLVDLHHRELSVTTIFRYAHTWPVAIPLVASGSVRLADLVTHRFPLAGAEQALTASATLPDVMKPMVLCQE